MSKIIHKAPESSLVALCVFFLAANSTLAAQNQKSSATDAQPVDSLSSLSKSIPKQQQQVKLDAEHLSLASAAVKSIPAQQFRAAIKLRKPNLTSASDRLNSSLALVVADSRLAKLMQPNLTQATFNKTLVNKASDAAQKITSVSPKLEALNITDESTYSDGEQTNSYSNVDSSDPMDQVSNVSQFSDVRPGDWAYDALRELVERYGCIAGYPDSTFRGNRAMTRYEFAAGLRACLNQIEKLIAASTTNFATKEDLEKLRRLTEEFQEELASLGTRVDKLEGRVGFLENHQFSVTTKMNAQIIADVGTFGTFGSNFTALPSGARTANRPQLYPNTIAGDRIRLAWDTSFTGKDRLRTRLEANNNTPFNAALTGTNETRIEFDKPGNLPFNGFVIGRLEYRFPATPSTTVWVDATGGELNDLVNTNNPFLQASGEGAISRFGRFNAIYRINAAGPNLGSGGAIIQQLGKAFTLSAAYLAIRGNDPTSNRGFFNGTYAALGQLNFQATKAWNVGLTYVHAYENPLNTANTNNVSDVNVTGAEGSVNANQPFTANVPTSVNAYGVETSFRVSQFLTISGWGGLEYVTAERSTTVNGVRVIQGQHSSSYNYGVTLAFPDLGKKGNLGAIILGQPPRATRNDSELPSGSAPNIAARRRDRNSAYHVEGQYRYQITNNVSVTPSFYVVFNPENYSRNPTEYVGVIRTLFAF